MEPKLDLSLPVGLNFFASERAFLKALSDKDEKQIRLFLDDQFSSIGMLGQVHGVDEFLKHFTANTHFRAVASNVSTVVQGSEFCCAVSEYEADVTLQGVSIRGLMVVTRTWVRRETEWKLLLISWTDARLSRSWERAINAIGSRPRLNRISRA